jgi:hypothetical protein
VTIYLSKREPGEIEFGIIYGGIALFAIILARFIPLLSLVPGCAFRILTGYPCPACGTTRALIHFSQARFLPAFAMNPLAFIALVGCILFFFYSIITFLFDFRRFQISLSETEKDLVRKIAFAIVFLNWLYLIFAL